MTNIHLNRTSLSSTHHTRNTSQNYNRRYYSRPNTRRPRLQSRYHKSTLFATHYNQQLVPKCRRHRRGYNHNDRRMNRPPPSNRHSRQRNRPTRHNNRQGPKLFSPRTRAMTDKPGINHRRYVTHQLASNITGPSSRRNSARRRCQSAHHTSRRDRTQNHNYNPRTTTRPRSTRLPTRQHTTSKHTRYRRKHRHSSNHKYSLRFASRLGQRHTNRRRNRGARRISNSNYRRHSPSTTRRPELRDAYYRQLTTLKNSIGGIIFTLLLRKWYEP